MFGWLTERRRSRLRSQEFPHSWLQILKRNVPIFRWLSHEDQHELLGHVQVFLDEKHFEGVGGLDLSDEVRVTIAAQACLLLLHRETDYYPELTSILVYPSAYIAHEDRYLGDNIAIIDVAGEIAGMKTPEGADAPTFKHHVTWIARKHDGKWMADGARAFAYVPAPAAKDSAGHAP